MGTAAMSDAPRQPRIRQVLWRALARNWWLLLFRGIAAIVFGLLALFAPSLTLLTLVLLWAVYAVMDGVFSLWAGISGNGETGVSRWWLATIGAVSIASGLLAFGWPGITALAMLIGIALWSIVTGALQVWGAIKVRKEIDDEWLLGLGGILSIVLGIGLLAWPMAGVLAMLWWIGLMAMLFGVTQVVLAFRLKRHA